MFGFRVGNPVCIKSPGVGKCPPPGEGKNFKCPPPGIEKWAKARLKPGGGGDGHSWN